MVKTSTIIKPNTFKILLFTLVFLPILAILIMVFELIYHGNLTKFIFFNQFEYLQAIYIPLLLSLILSYIVAGLIDHYIPSKNMKVSIAVISGLISLVVLYIFYKMITEPVVCDPVHRPPPGTNYHTKIFDDIAVDKKAVEESLKLCLSKLK